ncbi:hypothetical protein Q4575_05465 [Psychrosphaera sp. 1_MG-2023]|uniref:hypothetical protein n=1 Tax=Psychrosphaera sp. 1_MG-2023 TaxID=3062643 RepID=UPI0026E400C4|nr:hypothetical protein [Psychrosphaera sp. 1_MG-2023]MDO6718839.1 hypothetical protein [Psychrosphaera sp. 1_MG-2023]
MEEARLAVTIIVYLIIFLIPSVFCFILFAKEIKNGFQVFVNWLKNHSTKLLILAVLVYLFWLIFVMIKSNTWYVGNSTFDLWFPERTDEKLVSFWLSVASSTLDSAIFLLLISSVLGLKGLKDPKEEEYKRKIQNLFPEIDMHSDMGQYLQKKISFLACISPSAQRVITIDKISNCGNYIHLSMQTDCDIKNIHHNHQFSDELRYTITPDNIDFDEEYLVKVLKMKVIKHTSKRDNKCDVINHPITLKPGEDTQTFSRTLKLDLSPYDTATYLIHTMMWQDLSKPLNTSNVRYTLAQNYEIKNETGTDLYLKVNSPVSKSFMDKVKSRFNIDLEKHKEKLTNLKAGDVHNFGTGEVEPGEKVTLTFSKTKFEENTQ